MRVLIITRSKKRIERRLILFLQFPKLYDPSTPYVSLLPKKPVMRNTFIIATPSSIDKRHPIPYFLKCALIHPSGVFHKVLVQYEQGKKTPIFSFSISLRPEPPSPKRGSGLLMYKNRTKKTSASFRPGHAPETIRRDVFFRSFSLHQPQGVRDDVRECAAAKGRDDGNPCVAPVRIRLVRNRQHRMGEPRAQVARRAHRVAGGAAQGKP